MQVGVYRDKVVNAEEMLAQLKIAGFEDAFIKLE